MLYGFALVAGTRVTPTFAPLSLQVHWWAIVALTVVFVTFSIVGALVASHSPRNAVGWLFLGIGGAASLALALIVYVETSLPGRAWAEWAADWSSVTVFSQITFVLLLFPDGRLLSRHWRVAAWLTGLAGMGQVLGGAFSPNTSAHVFSNPLGIDAIRGTILQDGNIGWLLLPVAMVAAAASFVVRFRSSTGRRRQQLKWFALAASLVAFGYIVQNLLWLTTLLLELSASVDTALVAASILVTVSCFIAIPLASGVAILRYRLYDIDIIINRALVYGSLTAILALVYVAGSVGIGSLFRRLSGQQENDIVVAASTLLVAALFRPARARIQARVDKRFYRNRYDAQRTVEDFSTRLQDEVDLDALAGELVAVVNNTMQPTQVSVWLRHGAPSEGG
jgi:hypothetical protein